MNTVLLLVAATVVSHCAITHLRPETKIEDGFGTSVPLHNFLYTQESLSKEMKPLKEAQKKIEQRMKDTATTSSDYGRNLDISIFEINSASHTGQTLFQSDIVLTKRQAEQIFKDVEFGSRTKRHVLRKHFFKNSTWDNGVFYTFSTTDHLVKKAFKMGAKVWSDNTCVDFIEDNSAKDKVVVVQGAGCWSRNGRFGGDQLLSLGVGCETEGIAVHEIGHVLGLLHTMTRYDRDNFITVIMQNVDPAYRSEFAIMDSMYADVFGLSYDYGSIMQYGELMGSINDKPTMIARHPDHQKTMGSQIISFSDIYTINEQYGCNARCNRSTSAKCANEGFPHPRNCSKCICPSGYGGDLCDRRPPGCGEDLVATDEMQTVVRRLGFGSGLRDQFNFCNYMITAPEGKYIELDVRSISHGYDESGCPRGGVEIKAQEDQKMTGYRFCSTNGTGGSTASSSNRLPVILFNRFGVMQTIFMYRYID